MGSKKEVCISILVFPAGFLKNYDISVKNDKTIILTGSNNVLRILGGLIFLNFPSFLNGLFYSFSVCFLIAKTLIFNR